MSTPIKFSIENHIALVCLSRSDRHNALSPLMIRMLADLWPEIQLNRNVRAIILYGDGPSFCSGMDLKYTNPGFGYREEIKIEITPEELDLAKKYEGLPGERRKLNYVPPSNFSKPIISILQGNIRGGGLELALNSDIRLASEDATFGFPEVTRGIAAASGGMVLLPQIIGLGRAMELLLTGDAIDAAEAYRIGLVNKIVAKDELLNTAIKLAEKIASNAPLAVQATKETILRSIGISIAEGLSLSENQARNLLQTNDYKEGADAFIVKRAPKFIGS